MSGPLITSLLCNDYIYIPIMLLSRQQIDSIKAQTTYEDKAVAYQLKKMKQSFWAKKEVIDQLEAKRIVCLWKEQNGVLVLPQGFMDLLPEGLPIKDERTLPPLRTMIWQRKPKHSLRYYQREAIDELKKRARGQAVMATGTGKSFTMLNLIREMGLKTLVICPSSIIGSQLYEDFADAFGKRVVGMYGSGKKEIKQVTVGLYQSVCRNIDLFKDVELVICDENQTLGAGSLMSITRELAAVPYFYSVSATNYRADGKTPEIYACSGPVVYNFDTKRAIDEKFLAQPYFFVREVSSYGRDYDLKQKNYSEHVVQNGVLNHQICQDAERMINAGKSTLILVQEIEHGELIAKALNLPFANGENKGSIKLIKELNKGAIKGLVAGAQMCGVGVDTVRVDCLIMASFPGTKGLTTQLVGRGLRKYEGKTKVVVLDYRLSGNEMLDRHAEKRVDWYSELGPVKEIADVSTHS